MSAAEEKKTCSNSETEAAEAVFCMSQEKKEKKIPYMHVYAQQQQQQQWWWIREEPQTDQNPAEDTMSSSHTLTSPLVQPKVGFGKTMV